MRRNEANEPKTHRPKRANEVEKEKIDDQVCRIIYEHLDKEGYWRLTSREELCASLLVLGAVNTNIIRGRSNQLRHIEEVLRVLIDVGRVFFTESDGVCELSPKERHSQHIAARARRRKMQERQVDRRTRRAQERQAPAT